MLLAKNKLNTIKFFVSKTLFILHINHHELVLVNNVLRECNEMTEEIKNSKNAVE